MKFVTDLHIHSKYSRAVSQGMVLSEMEKWALKKGIDVLSAADFTHPLWFRELKSQLVGSGEGIYKLKDSDSNVRFILSTEISSIYTQGGRVRRIHNLIFMPSLESVEKFNNELFKRGANLNADGRPIIGLSSRNLLEIVLSVHPDAFLIPCHVWTPWFSLYGSNSGFDSIEECFQDLSSQIFGIETGLSSDPEMNWRIKELDNRSILSFSDAHSAIKMGREATVFELKELSFENLKKAVQSQSLKGLGVAASIDKRQTANDTGIQTVEPNRISYTIEFYPEEGKYHYTGHRNCKISQTPEETKEKGVICSVCKRPLTVGVMHRVNQLADSNIKYQISNIKSDEFGATWIHDSRGLHPPYVKLVPLVEVIAESFGVMPGSLKVLSKFDEMVSQLGSELNVLLKTPVSDIEKSHGEKIAQALAKVRKQDIVVSPGFDGEFGKVKIWVEASTNSVQEIDRESQLGLFQE